ncbi:MAG: 3'-5' exonuclease [Gemmatimonadales bacterium]|nr:MAG: 3'-5' exonuclease [Gemmatimonadales bacterium]
MPDPLPFPVPLERPLVFFDLETTGLRVEQDRIVELAIIRLSPGGDLLERVRRFNPGIPIPAEASAVHGITDADVADKPPFASRARSLADLLEPCDLAGFNVRRFDLPMLLAEFDRAGVSFDARSRRVVDVQMIFHREEPRDLSAAVRFYLGRELEGAHSALADIRATAQVLGAQMERYGHLPRDLEGLHDYCDEVRPFETALDRWFEAGEDGALRFRRGKHTGVPLAEVARAHPDYLQWMLGLDDLAAEVKEAVRAALTGP